MELEEDEVHEDDEESEDDNELEEEEEELRRGCSRVCRWTEDAILRAKILLSLHPDPGRKSDIWRL